MSFLTFSIQLRHFFSTLILLFFFFLFKKKLLSYLFSFYIMFQHPLYKPTKHKDVQKLKLIFTKFYHLQGSVIKTVNSIFLMKGLSVIDGVEFVCLL